VHAWLSVSQLTGDAENARHENAGLENAGALNLQDLKMTDHKKTMTGKCKPWKMTDLT